MRLLLHNSGNKVPWTRWKASGPWIKLSIWMSLYRRSVWVGIKKIWCFFLLCEEVVVVVGAGAVGSACTLLTKEYVAGVTWEGPAWGYSSLLGTPIDAIWVLLSWWALSYVEIGWKMFFYEKYTISSCVQGHCVDSPPKHIHKFLEGFLLQEIVVCSTQLSFLDIAEWDGTI